MRQAPYAQREPRAQLDVALAAAALEVPLEVHFIGNGVWQLARQHQPAAADLSRGLKGWAAVAEMTEARFFVETDALELVTELGVDTVVEVEALGRAAMSRRWRGVTKVLML